MKIFVGNLSYDSSERAIAEYFSQVGVVTHVHKALDKNCMPGIAFVGFKNDADARKAIEELHDTIFDGRKITVAPAHRQ